MKAKKIKNEVLRQKNGERRKQEKWKWSL